MKKRKEIKKKKAIAILCDDGAQADADSAYDTLYSFYENGFKGYANMSKKELQKELEDCYPGVYKVI